MQPAGPLPIRRPRWQHVLWLLAGIVGIFLPLQPSTPFLRMAAICFSHGSLRYEACVLNHPRFGPMVSNWRANPSIPLRAEQLATRMMAVGSAWATWAMPPRSPWLPALRCLGVAAWMWSLPTVPAPSAAEPPGVKPPRCLRKAAPRWPLPQAPRWPGAAGYVPALRCPA
jgi:hypothetical protein